MIYALVDPGESCPSPDPSFFDVSPHEGRTSLSKPAPGRTSGPPAVPRPKALTLLETASRACRYIIYQNLVREDAKQDIHITDSAEGDARHSLDGLEGQYRIADCLASRGHGKEAITMLKDAIGEMGHTGPVADGFLPIAYAHLAILEARAGRTADAEQHATLAHRGTLNESGVTVSYTIGLDEIERTYRVLGGSARRAQEMMEARAFAAATEGMSADQKAVYREMGPPADEETYDARGYHKVTWWYGATTRYAAYMFVNGVLDGVYRP